MALMKRNVGEWRMGDNIQNLGMKQAVRCLIVVKPFAFLINQLYQPSEAI